MTVRSQSFRFRSFISFLVTLSFLIASISGIVLYFRPEGSLTRWVGWHIMELDKRQWEGIHTTMVLIFMVAAVFHLIYNWKTLARYLKKGTSILRSLSFELICALGITTLFIFLTISHLPPASWILNLRENIKDGAAVLEIPPPAPDADNLTFAEICNLHAITPEQLDSRLKNMGVVVDTQNTWGEIANANQLSPEELYIKAFGNEKHRVIHTIRP